MQDSGVPPKIPLPFANGAGGPYINAIPLASQIGITNGAASYTDGFPPLTFVSLSAGGSGPFGKDFNGLLNQVTAGLQWAQAGGPWKYDGTFATQIGGYPQGAIIASASTFGLFWLSTADNNTVNPDNGPSPAWIPIFFSNVRQYLTANTTFYTNFATGNDTTGNGSITAPWQTVQHAYNYCLANIDGKGFNITINQAGTDTVGCIVNADIPGVGAFMINITGTIQTSGNATGAVNGGTLYLMGSGLIESSGANCVIATGGGRVFISGPEIGSAGVAQLQAVSGSLIQPYGPFSMTGNASYGLLADGGQIRFDITINPTYTVTMTSTPVYATAMAQAGNNGLIDAPSGAVNFSGAATGKRYQALAGGGIQTSSGGANYFPGSIAGTADNSNFAWYE